MSSNNNRINVPQAKQAMEQFKMQAANEVGVNLQQGYNGHLTSREAGSIGGQMVKQVNATVHEENIAYRRKTRTKQDHSTEYTYQTSFTV